MVATETCTICNTAEPDEWAQCDICSGWQHLGCARLPPKYVRELVEYHCAGCEEKAGPSIEPRNSKRRRMRLNYAALNEGIIEIERTHAHARWFGTSRFARAPFPRVDGTQIPHALDTPVVIPARFYDSIDMRLPAGLDLRAAVALLGTDKTVPVMDVVTQNVVPGWTLGKWCEYMETQDRKQTFNVISLEFSDTALSTQVTRPAYVRDSDLVDKVWLEGASVPRPKVGNYCLSSVTGAYTDFHVDFGGTSVFYHVVSGHKSFLFIPPTKQNLQIYEKWCLSPDQATTFFPDLVDECWRVDIGPGDTILLPSGWIHAVYTPEDALVIGGNFLTLHDLRMQLRVQDLERKTKVPSRFTFPHFQAVLWYTAAWLCGQDHVDIATAEELSAYLEAHRTGRPREVSLDVASQLRRKLGHEVPCDVGSEPGPKFETKLDTEHQATLKPKTNLKHESEHKHESEPKHETSTPKHEIEPQHQNHDTELKHETLPRDTRPSDMWPGDTEHKHTPNSLLEEKAPHMPHTPAEPQPRIVNHLHAIVDAIALQEASEPVGAPELGSVGPRTYLY